MPLAAATHPPPHAAAPRAAGPLAAYAGVRVLVTGASGFIGGWVWRLLAEHGAEVWAAGRDGARLRGSAPAGAGGGIAVADLSVPGAMAELIRRLRPAVTFNLAGYGVGRSERDAALSRRVNAGVPAEAARALASAPAERGWDGLRLVHTGSAFEYGCVAGTVDEDTAPVPATRYGRDKLAGTAAVAAARAETGLRAATVRVATVYGPGEHPDRLLPTLLRAARTREAVALTAGEQARDFTWVGDVAEGLLRVGLRGAAPAALNLATGRACTVRDFAVQAMRAAGIPPAQVRFGAVPYAPDEVWQGPLDVRRACALLGWLPPTPVADGIRAAHAAFTPHSPDRP